jgi:methyl-CpG-binding domain protein 4
MQREILIQEDYIHDPWKMLICCILLNQTNNKQVRPILSSVFELIPTPMSTIGCDIERLAAVIKTTGFQNVKASRIIKLSQKWVDGFEHVSQLPGIGKYGADSWEIFINKNLSVLPSDTKLRSYLRDIKNPSLSEGI